MKDFTAITMTSIAPNWVLVSPQLGVKTLKDFVALAKSKPNQLNFGSAGVGSFMQFAAAMFDDAVGIQAQHVPYKGPPEALADTVAGRVQFVVSPIGAALGLVRAGKLIPLAVTGTKRLTEFPNVPTVAESGYPGFELLTWTGLLAPEKSSATDPHENQSHRGRSSQGTGRSTEAAGDLGRTDFDYASRFPETHCRYGRGI